MGVVGGNEAGMVSQMGPRRHTARTQHVQGSQSGMPVVCTYRLLSTGNVRASLHRLCLQGLGLPQVQTTPASAKQTPPPPRPRQSGLVSTAPREGLRSTTTTVPPPIRRVAPPPPSLPFTSHKHTSACTLHSGARSTPAGAACDTETTDCADAHHAKHTHAPSHLLR